MIDQAFKECNKATPRELNEDKNALVKTFKKYIMGLFKNEDKDLETKNEDDLWKPDKDTSVSKISKFQDGKSKKFEIQSDIDQEEMKYVEEEYEDK